MLKFKSKLFEDIDVEGAIKLKAKRDFKFLRDFDLSIFNKNDLLISISSRNKLLKTKYTLKENNSAFDIKILNNLRLKIDDYTYEVKSEKLYPLKQKYAKVYIDKEYIGDIIFIKKWLNIVLEFKPINHESLDEKNTFENQHLNIIKHN